MLLLLLTILLANPDLASSCGTSLHPLHMRGILSQSPGLSKRQFEPPTVPSRNQTHWTVAENLREMQVTDDAFNTKDLPRYNHAPSVRVFYQGGVTMNLTAHYQDMALLYSSFPSVAFQNHDYPLRFGEGDWTVTVTRATGTNDGPLPGSDGLYSTPTHRRTDYDFMTIGRWESGLLLEEYLFSDSVVQYRQLGLLPSPPPPADRPELGFDVMGDTGEDQAAGNKLRVNASDMAFNAGSENKSELLYSDGLKVFGLTDYPLDLSGYLGWIGEMRGAFPDLEFVHRRVIAQGGWTASLGMLSGTQKGAWRGLPGYISEGPIAASGKGFDLLHYVIARWENGTIAEMRVNFDVFGVLSAIGVDI